jgi:hypothetical protein
MASYPGRPTRPGQHVIPKVVKRQAVDGAIRAARSKVYNKVVPFVAFIKLDGNATKAYHDGGRR